MAAEGNLKPGTFLNDVALLGARISHVIHNYVTLERPIDRRLQPLVTHLDATVQALNRLSELIKDKTDHKAVLNVEGRRYVEVLVEECAVAMGRIRWIMMNDPSCMYPFLPQHWKTTAVISKSGAKELEKVEIDEAAMSQGLVHPEKYRKFRQLRGTAQRFEELQLHLLLVVHVMMVQKMTKSIPTGVDQLREFVEYQKRVTRAAKLAGFSDRAGKALSRQRIFSYANSYSDSDSDVSIVSPRRRRSPVRRFPPPPPPPGWGCPPPPVVNRFQPPPPPPGWTPPPPVVIREAPAPMKPPFVEVPLAQSEPIKIQSGENLDSDNLPPAYKEKEGQTAAPKAGGACHESKKDSDAPVTVVSDRKEDTPAELGNPSNANVTDKVVAPVASGHTPLLKSESSKFGLRFKSLFRSKTSLEAEMKKNLEDANASLKAFIVQEDTSQQVPHSAFHSLEYTHMRTILSQLRDSTWFKVFQDLTGTEHKTLQSVLARYVRDGRWVERELVVLKVLQQNRFNAWIRIIEECIGSEGYRFGFRYENGRILFAIVREKLGEAIKFAPPPPPMMLPPPTSPTWIEFEEKLPAAPVPELLPFIPRDGKVISDLSKVGTLTIESRHNGPASGYTPRNQPPGPPATPGAFRRPPQSNPWQHSSSPSAPSTPPTIATHEGAACQALTSYTSFTFRPAPPDNGLAWVHIPTIAWSYCVLTREHETKRDLIKRIDHFKRRGVSIIDMKLRLRDDQSAQVTRLVEELNWIEKDSNFEHTLVELSQADIINCVINRPHSPGVIDVIHVIVQRAPKDTARCVEVYNKLMNPAPPPPPPPPIIIDDSPIIIDCGRKPVKRRTRNRSRSISRSSSSGSGSDSDSSFSSSSYSSRRRRRSSSSSGSDFYASDASSDDEDGGNLRHRRWKVDPILIKFGKEDKGEDVVKLLLDRWTGEVKGGEKAEEVDDKKKSKTGSRRNHLMDD